MTNLKEKIEEVFWRMSRYPGTTGSRRSYGASCECRLANKWCSVLNLCTFSGAWYATGWNVSGRRRI